MTKRILIALLCGMFLIGCAAPKPPSGLGSYSELHTNPNEAMGLMKNSKSQEEFVELVAKTAKSKNKKDFITLIDPKQLPPSSQEIDEFLDGKIFPFFDQFARIHNYQGVSRAVTADGRTGVWHYKYMVDTTGKLQPFQIAVVDTSEGPKILDLVPNKCTKNRHPTCDLSSLSP